MDHVVFVEVVSRIILDYVEKCSMHLPTEGSFASFGARVSIMGGTGIIVLEA